MSTSDLPFSAPIAARLTRLSNLERRQAGQGVAAIGAQWAFWWATLIVLSDHASERAQRLVRRQGLDALLSAPFSMHDLTSRLAAFSLRARPTY